MRTISQVARLTGVSVRTLQYYDKTGLLKPSAYTPSGYRLYDDTALQRLQQILFFKELDFRLSDIQRMMQEPGFNETKAFKQQKELLVMKRKRLDRLIDLLDKLEKGERSVSFREFDLSEYVEALEQFKTQKSEEVIKYWGSIEEFEQFIQKVKDDEAEVAELAVKQFGSVEKYTEAMKYNLEHFSELMEHAQGMKEQVDDIVQEGRELNQKLTADKTKDVASPEIQDIVRQIVEHTDGNTLGIDMGENFWDLVIESYSNADVRRVTEEQYGEGAAEYMASALKYYFSR